MKSIIAYGDFTVSFNTDIGGYDLGDSYRNTVDFAGDDIDQLAAEVIADDPAYPIVFERTDDDLIVGVFRSVEDDYVVAVMY